MSTKRTPWAVVDGHSPSMKEISGPSFKISCVMWAGDLTEADYVARDADLNLIAAAPDLLCALQSLLTAYQTVHGIGDLETQPAIFFARKCIAAATGETA